MMEIEEHFRAIMELLGLDLTDPSLAKTPARIAKMYSQEIFTGLNASFPKIATIASTSSQQITIRDISFVSFCAHHFLPMFGKATISYTPNGKILGLSTFHQIVHHFAKRPQLQERLTDEIAHALGRILETEMTVKITAEHGCVRARGVEDQNSYMETTTISALSANG